jgi:uncharacterized protein (TIGR02270 family)
LEWQWDQIYNSDWQPRVRTGWSDIPNIESIIAQHPEEAAFLWLLRDAACHEPHYLVKDLAKLDDRVEAHLDGLRIAGTESEAVCDEVWAMEDAGEIFAASELSFEGSDPARIDRVLEIAASTPELSRGGISALGCLHYDQTLKKIGALLWSGDATFAASVSLRA